MSHENNDDDDDDDDGGGGGALSCLDLWFLSTKVNCFKFTKMKNCIYIPMEEFNTEGGRMGETRGTFTKCCWVGTALNVQIYEMNTYYIYPEIKLIL